MVKKTVRFSNSRPPYLLHSNKSFEFLRPLKIKEKLQPAYPGHLSTFLGVQWNIPTFGPPPINANI